MNKREKAIWNLVIGISCILLIVFINNILIGLFSSSGSNYFQINQKNSNFKDHLSMAGDYSLPLNANLMKLFKKYNIDADDIIKRSKEKEVTAPTQSRLKGFMEYRKVKSKTRKPYSFINGFSLDDKKIAPGNHLLTEIAGDIFSDKSKCKDKSKIFLKDVSFMNDSQPLIFHDFKDIKEDPDHNSSNYYYIDLNDNNNLEVHINTNEELDEYSFETSCFEASTSELLESLNELEIALKRQREANFNLNSDVNDPTDLSNVIMLDGQGGYNQGKKFKTLIPTVFYQNRNTEQMSVKVLYKGERTWRKEGDEIADGRIIKINRDYFLFEKNGEIDTLKIISD